MTWIERYYAKHQRQIGLHSNNLRDANPVYLRVKHGGRLYVGVMGQGSGQRRDIQNDQPSIQHSDRGHDRVSKRN